MKYTHAYVLNGLTCIYAHTRLTVSELEHYVSRSTTEFITDQNVNLSKLRVDFYIHEQFSRPLIRLRTHGGVKVVIDGFGELSKGGEPTI